MEITYNLPSAEINGEGEINLQKLMSFVC